MDAGLYSSEKQRGSEEEAEIDQLRKGPWTVEEDLVLVNYIAIHGEGRWNALACAGLKRTGKSCRLRWLNYLHPDVRRGNITPEEQLLILELHSRWGNRWSQIAKHLPGRTDNEVKNFWRTRVKKQAKKLRCEVNSRQFKDTVRHIWVPHLLQRIRAANAATVHFHHPITSSNVAVPLEEEPVISFVPEVEQHILAGGGATVTANSISINATDSYESDGAASRMVSPMASDLDDDGKHGIMTTHELGASSQCQDDHHIDVVGGADRCCVGDAHGGLYELGAGSDVYRGEIPAWGIDGEAYQYGDYTWSSIDEVWFNWPQAPILL